jgi:hypothetical protein
MESGWSLTAATGRRAPGPRPLSAGNAHSRVLRDVPLDRGAGQAVQLLMKDAELLLAPPPIPLVKRDSATELRLSRTRHLRHDWRVRILAAAWGKRATEMTHWSVATWNFAAS